MNFRDFKCCFFQLDKLLYHGPMKFFNELFGKYQVIDMLSDNQGAIYLAKDDKFHQRTKHIDIRYHFIRQHVENGDITLVYCATENMTADILTKALPSMKQKHFALSLGLTRL